MNAASVHYETKHVAVVTLDNPPLNSLSWESRQALVAALDRLDGDDNVRCLVITGAGRAFSAGADLREDGGAIADSRLPAFLEEFRRILVGIERFRAPVIAAINGPCIGAGLELALSCDVRLASTDATFVASGVNVGLIASFFRLPRIVGEGRANHMLLSGRLVGAEHAERWGLVSAVHEPDDLMPATLELAERIATRAPLAVEATKNAVRQGRCLDADSAQQLQESLLLELFGTDDHQEAVRAFLEKRPASYGRR